MNTMNKEGKCLMLPLKLWGLIQVVGGVYVLVNLHGRCGFSSPPLMVPPLMLAACFTFITSGICTLVFAFVRGKVLNIAVVLTSLLSLIPGFYFFFMMTALHEKKGENGNSF